MSHHIVTHSDFVFMDEYIERHSSDKTAIKFEKQSLSYRQLNDNVNTLACQLISDGVARGEVVSTLFDSGIEATVALLAIVKIGAIYAPLDPEQPINLLVQRVDILNIKVLLIHEKLEILAKQLSAPYKLYQISVDLAELVPPRVTRNPLDPACIFFTSGTTGEPKGVVGSALALRESILQPANTLRFTENDSLNSIARYAWSISMLEFMAPLIFGGLSLILDHKKVLNFDWLSKQVEHCTAFHCPPALLKPLAEYILDNNISTPHTRIVWYGGDVFTPQAIKTIQKAFPNSEVGTAYGSTEIFGLSHIHIYPKKPASFRVLIGKPIYGIKQIIEGCEKPNVNADPLGELLMGGDRLMLGYWDDGYIDKANILKIDDCNYYKTGDFVRVTKDNDIEFVERRDSQVKIRGIRVELGEVNSIICSNPKVEDCLTIPVADGDDKQIRAFVIAPNITAKVLRSELNGKMPDYMIPSSIQILDRFPVTENFKIDRKALLDWTEKKETTIALSKTMRDVAAIWEKFARIRIEDPDSNFFENGGNSMAAAILSAAMTRELEIRIDVADIYSLPTLRLISQKIDSHDLHEVTNKNILSYPAAFGQMGLFFRELFSQEESSITCTRYFFNKNPFELDVVRTAIKNLITRHSTLRAKLKIASGKFCLETIPDEMIQDSKIEIVVFENSISLEDISKIATKFDLRDDTYLIKAFIMPLSSGGELIQLTCHHIAADDNSMDRVGKDFCTIYQALIDNQPFNLHRVEQHYGDFAKEQQKTSDHYLERALSIGQKLVGYSQNLSIEDLDMEEGAMTYKIDINKADITFAEFVASISWGLGQGHQQKTFVFCLHVALQRDSTENPNVGMFVNLVPMFCDYNQDWSGKKHLSETITSLNSAIGRSNIPYEQILMSEPTLKKLKHFPFDAYLNELVFDDIEVANLKGVVIPRSFSTNKRELSISLVRSSTKVEVQVDTPLSKKINRLDSNILNSYIKPL